VQRTQASKLRAINAPTSSFPAQASVASDTIKQLPAMVNLNQLVQHPSLNSLVVGVGDNGPMALSLGDLMHTLAIGASGWGKSVFLRSLLWQIAQAKEDIRVIAIDTNGSEFNLLRGWSKLALPVARDNDAAIQALNAVHNEIARRKKLYEQFPVAYDLDSYNTKAQEKLAPWLIVIDEGTNLLADKELGEPLREAAQCSRQYGLYILLAGQSAKSSVIDTATRDNFSTRLCFHTSKRSYSTVLDQSVEDINDKGRAYVIASGRELQEIQCPFVSRSDLMRVLHKGEPQTIVDITPREPEGERIEDNPELPDAERIRLLAAQGLSRAEIERTVFGHKGGAAYRKVKEVLG